MTIKNKFIYVIMAAAATLCPPSSRAQQKSVDAAGHQWWQHAVFYEIYPRSFADSNNNGIGDLNGIDLHLDYLKAARRRRRLDHSVLPFSASGFRLRRFRLRSHRSHVRHARRFRPPRRRRQKTQHQRDSRFRRQSHFRPAQVVHRFQILKNFRPPRLVHLARRQRPRSAAQQLALHFRPPGWTLDPKTNQYYYHYFYPEQPDLNWRNPAVEKAMLDVTRFWYKRGVAGFRLDAVDTLYEDPNLTDNPARSRHRQIRPPQSRRKIQQETARSTRRHAQTPQRRRRIRLRADRRNLDHQCRTSSRITTAQKTTNCKCPWT